jgi:hypothetical protein
MLNYWFKRIYEIKSYSGVVVRERPALIRYLVGGWSMNIVAGSD